MTDKEKIEVVRNILLNAQVETCRIELNHFEQAQVLLGAIEKVLLLTREPMIKQYEQPTADQQVLDIVKDIRTNPICITDARLVDAIELLAGKEIKKTVKREAECIDRRKLGNIGTKIPCDDAVTFRIPYGTEKFYCYYEIKE